MIAAIAIAVVLFCLVKLAVNSGVPNSVKEEQHTRRMDVRWRQRPLGYILLGLLVIGMVAANAVLQHVHPYVQP
jgi:uncharacterized membrane protein YdjX (TVP38/TMEM64 family)